MYSQVDGEGLMWTLDNSYLFGQMLPPGLKGSIGRPFFTHCMSDLSIYIA